MKFLDCRQYSDDIKFALKEYDFNVLDGKTVLVTGAMGLIGSALVDTLLGLKKFYNMDIRIFAAVRNAKRVRERFGDEGVIPLEYDAAIPQVLPENIDYIIHSAGIATPDLYVKKPVETMLSNVNGITNLLQYCVQNHTKAVYISSSEVYGRKDNEEPFHETDYGYIDQDNIRNSYAEAKRASEMLCRSYAKEYGVSVSIIRPGHIYGPSVIKEDKRISSDFAVKAAKGEKLEMLSAGLQKRSYCYSIDTACAILTCLLKGIPGEAYNIGVRDIISIRQMAECLAKAGGVPLCAKEPSEEERAAFNPMNNSSLSYEKLYELGFRDVFPAQIGLDHTVKILRECMQAQ